MEQKFKTRIVRNLDYLTNSTCSIVTVCVTLVSRECLTIGEFQIVRSQPSDEQKCMELYSRLLQKPNAFKLLLEALEDSGNEHVARKLRQPTEEELRPPLKIVNQNEDMNLKSKVSYEQLDWIEEILCRMDNNYWNNFMRRLLRFDTKILNDIEKMCKSESHSELVHKTLSAWLYVNGDAATIESLVKALSESQLNYAADSLKKQFSNRRAEKCS